MPARNAMRSPGPSSSANVVSDGRKAAERAIDIAKHNKSGTWESLVVREMPPVGTREASGPAKKTQKP
jgi:hypothetical protein